jgi:hypothetical protein
MRTFLPRSVDAVRPAAGGTHSRVLVKLTLDCGCRVERTVIAQRVIEVEDIEGNKSYFVAGRFVCDSHSPEAQ